MAEALTGDLVVGWVRRQILMDNLVRTVQRMEDSTLQPLFPRLLWPRYRTVRLLNWQLAKYPIPSLVILFFPIYR